MRKLLLSLVCLLFLAGVTLAVEAVFVKFDGEKKELTVKEGDKENVYKVTDKTKVSSYLVDLHAFTRDALGSKTAAGLAKEL